MDSDDAAAVIREVVGTDLTVREHAILIGLGRRNEVVAISDGVSTERSVCVLRENEYAGYLFHESAPEKIVGVIMGHNHPSGDAQPSPEDIRVTRKFACRLGILDVYDHVIVSTGLDPQGVVVPSFRKVFSMREEYGESLFERPECKSIF